MLEGHGGNSVEVACVRQLLDLIHVGLDWMRKTRHINKMRCREVEAAILKT